MKTPCKEFTIKPDWNSFKTYIVCSSEKTLKEQQQDLLLTSPNMTVNEQLLLQPPNRCVESVLSLKKNFEKLSQAKVEKNLKGSLESIPSPTPSVKIQIMGRKVCFMCKGKTLLGVVNKLFENWWIKIKFQNQPTEATRHHNLTKSSILLPLRVI